MRKKLKPPPPAEYTPFPKRKMSVTCDDQGIASRTVSLTVHSTAHGMAIVCIMDASDARYLRDMLNAFRL